MYSRYLFQLLFVALLFCFPRDIKSNETLILKNVEDPVIAGFYLNYFEDKDSRLSRNDFLPGKEPPGSIKSDVKVPNLGLGLEATYWFWLDLENRTESDQKQLYLIFDYPHLDNVDIFFLKAGKFNETVSFGDKKFFKDRPVGHRNFLIPFELEAEEKTRILIRLDTRSVMKVGLSIQDQRSFWEFDAKEIIIQGAYFGIMAVMALYNLFIFFTLKNKAYLYYVVFVSFFIIFQLCNNGFDYQYLWPLSPWLHEKALPFSIGVSVSFLGFFSIEFLDLSRTMPRTKKWVRLIAFVSLISGTLSIILPYGVAIKIMVIIVLSGSVSYMFTGFSRARQGNVEAIYYVLAFLSFLFFGLLMALRNMGLFPSMFLSDYGPQIGSTFEVILLSLALGRRLKSLQDENLNIQEQAASTLMKKVDERTMELRIKSEEAENARLESERLRADAIEQAEKIKEVDKQKTHFFQNISHELRTPLTLIMGPLESLRAEFPNHTTLEVADRNSKRLYRLVNQLLDFQKLSADKKNLSLVPIHLESFLRTCADYFSSAAESKKISFDLDLSSLKGHKISAEADALEKIIFNYLSNALKYTPEGGSIILKASLRSNDVIRISVADTGRGISVKEQEKLFKVFSQVDDSTTREYEGTGLGLALVKELAEKMNGEVGVISEPGKGAIFFVDFVCFIDAKNIVDLLIVEDDSNVINSLENLFDNSVHANIIHSLTSFSLANEFIANNQVSCIISDARLGDGDGISLLTNFSNLNPDGLRILITGDADQKMLERSINEAKIDRIFNKPWLEKDLLQVVDTYLEQKKNSLNVDDSSSFKVKNWHLVEDQSSVIESDELSLDTNQKKQLILVVDDLRDMRSLIVSTLSKNSFRTIEAINGKEAMKKAKDYKPDLIISDWMMPIMSGPEMIREIKSDDILKTTPVVLLTAKSDEESKLIGKKTGADAYLGKPFNSVELISTITNLLQLKEGERKILELNNHITENVLKRYLPEDFVDKVLRGDVELDQNPKTSRITLLFSDLVGFTALSEKLEAEKISEILNQYLSLMIEIIEKHNGTIDKFMGDGMMVFWGAPNELDQPEQVRLASNCAKTMQVAMNDLNLSWRKSSDLSPLKMRIGLHSGKAVVGNFGNEKRSDYSAIGPDVNLASRIETVCSPGDIFISESVSAFLDDSSFEEAGEHQLKGIKAPVRLKKIKL